MINNTSLQKWERLNQKQLDTQFINRLQAGLNCSPIEAMGIMNIVYEVYMPFLDNLGSIKPGQVLFQAVGEENSPKLKLSECTYKTVVLTIDGGQNDLRMREEQGVAALRRHRLERISNEAFQQGALLTVEDIANRLLNCGESTVSRDLKVFKDKGIVLPLRSTVKDMGKGITHRVSIVREWLRGKEYSQIARLTNHSVEAVSNYIDKFRRVVCLAKEGYEIESIAFLVKISIPLAREYYRLYTDSRMVAVRREELLREIKKNMCPLQNPDS